MGNRDHRGREKKKPKKDKGITVPAGKRHEWTPAKPATPPPAPTPDNTPQR